MTGHFGQKIDFLLLVPAVARVSTLYSESTMRKLYQPINGVHSRELIVERDILLNEWKKRPISSDHSTSVFQNSDSLCDNAN